LHSRETDPVIGMIESNYMRTLEALIGRWLGIEMTAEGEVFSMLRSIVVFCAPRKLRNTVTNDAVLLPVDLIRKVYSMLRRA